MVRGRLERVEEQTIVGWLLDETDPTAKVQFDLVVNGIPVGSFIADRLRGDLKRKGIGDGRHAFRIGIETHWLQPGQNTIHVEPHNNRRAIPDILTFDFEPPESDNPDYAVQYLAKRTGTTPDGIVSILNEPALWKDTKAISPAIRTLRNRSARPKQEAPVSIPHDDAVALLSKLISEGGLKEAALFPILEQLFKAGRNRDVIIVGEAASGQADTYRCRNYVGRAYLNLGRYQEAIRVLSLIKDSEPKRHGAIYYLGIAFSKAQRFQAAYDTFLHCIGIKEDEAKYHLEAARCSVALAFGGYGVTSHKPEFVAGSIQHYRRAATLAPGDFRPLREIAPIYLHVGEFDNALAAAREATERGAKESVAWLELSRTLARLNRIDEALDACRTAANIDPQSDGANFAVRILERFQQQRARDVPHSIAVFSDRHVASQEGSEIDFLTIPKNASSSSIIAQLDTEWLTFDDRVLDSKQLVSSQIKARGYNWAAALELQLPNGQRLYVWRRRFLARLFKSGNLSLGADENEITRVAERVGALVCENEPERHDLAGAKPVAMLVSQYGIHKFGGAEQFLEQMGHLYRELGYSVLVVGTRAEYIGDSGEHGGLRYTFVEGSADELFRTAVDENASLVHVVSGLGYEIASAMHYLRASLVFGVHFWRELFYNPTPSLGYYPDIDQGAEVRPEFDLILSSFDAVYSNSIYTRDVLERTASIRTPVIYSLPDNVSENSFSVEASERTGVLLVNARADKGFDLLLDIAEALPDIHFIAIASQSGRVAAEALISERRLRNVEILSRVSDMSELYRRVRVVLVPSFRFVETFSRVVIEAQRYGVPVIGSDRGNVPHLLADSGISLPEDPKSWALEIRRLHDSVEYWTERSKSSTENSERYSFSSQKTRLARLVSGLKRPILIGVGSGLGNVIHTTPLLRNISIRLGRRVDVVVAGDYKDLLFCVSNEEYVSHAFLLNQNVLARRYETVFLTHSFGSVIPSFSANRIIESRAWDMFSADHPFHEAEFNLAAAEALLGIGYEEQDVKGYFVGDYKYLKPERTLVGLHGGSKGGVWASKRWPHFGSLADALLENGIAVASFGTSDEYVPGTLDMTGGTIQEMTQKMLSCTHFVSNDSGVMNLANALGIPLVALFGPTNPATRGPLAALSRSLFVGKECAPCEMHPTERRESFLTGECRCIADIPLSEVLVALRSLGLTELEQFSQAPA